MKLLHATSGEISHNSRIKTYPDGSQEIMTASRAVFREPGWEQENAQRASALRESDPGANVERSSRRARAAVRDLALSNGFSYFVTLTLDAERIERYDMGEIIKRLNVWLDNRVRRKGLKYILVPEEHQDGAIHFHGFFNDALPAVDSGHTDAGGHRIYNLPAWDFGFSTAIELYGEYSRAVGYVCKYIGKCGKKIGGRWYLSGGGLQRPKVEYADLDFAEAYAEADYTFNVEAARAAFAIVRRIADEN